MRRILLSLHHEWAAALYSREKHFEFRRQRMDINPGDVVVIYETRPVKMVTGEFVVRAVHYGSPTQLKRRETNPGRRRSVGSYLNGARHPTALEIAKPRRYRRPKTLADLGVSRAPVSYRRLRDNNPR
jgi:predicted transcriptional regulator